MRSRTVGVRVLAAALVVAALMPASGCAAAGPAVKAAGSAASEAVGNAASEAAGNAASATAGQLQKKSDDAKTRACFAEQHAVEAAAQAFGAQKEAFPQSVQELVDAGLLRKLPSCPGGGKYTWDAVSVRCTCSVHGHWQE